MKLAYESIRTYVGNAVDGKTSPKVIVRDNDGSKTISLAVVEIDFGSNSSFAKYVEFLKDVLANEESFAEKKVVKR